MHEYILEEGAIVKPTGVPVILQHDTRVRTQTDLVKAGLIVPADAQARYKQLTRNGGSDEEEGQDKTGEPG